jgi:hypothetical protein
MAGSTPALSKAASTATAPRSEADRGAKVPLKPPIGVRAADTITASFFCLEGVLDMRVLSIVS